MSAVPFLGGIVWLLPTEMIWANFLQNLQVQHAQCVALLHQLGMVVGVILIMCVYTSA